MKTRNESLTTKKKCTLHHSLPLFACLTIALTSHPLHAAEQAEAQQNDALEKMAEVHNQEAWNQFAQGVDQCIKDEIKLASAVRVLNTCLKKKMSKFVALQAEAWMHMEDRDKAKVLEISLKSNKNFGKDFQDCASKLSLDYFDIKKRFSDLCSGEIGKRGIDKKYTATLKKIDLNQEGTKNRAAICIELQKAQQNLALRKKENSQRCGETDERRNAIKAAAIEIDNAIELALKYKEKCYQAYDTPNKNHFSCMSESLKIYKEINQEQSSRRFIVPDGGNEIELTVAQALALNTACRSLGCTDVNEKKVFQPYEQAVEKKRAAENLSYPYPEINDYVCGRIDSDTFEIKTQIQRNRCDDVGPDLFFAPMKTLQGLHQTPRKSKTGELKKTEHRDEPGKDAGNTEK